MTRGSHNLGPADRGEENKIVISNHVKRLIWRCSELNIVFPHRLDSHSVTMLLVK